MTHHEFYKIVGEKLLQYAISIGGGFLIAIETSVPFLLPCLATIILDVASAYFLNRRLHKRNPEKTDGKFKSTFKFRVLYTMFVIFLLIVIANYVDNMIIKDSDMAVRFVIGVFLFYECWSILENWSSENDNKLAKSLQRVMVNKAERHFNIQLSDILLDQNKSNTQDKTTNQNDPTHDNIDERTT